MKLQAVCTYIEAAELENFKESHTDFLTKNIQKLRLPGKRT